MACHPLVYSEQSIAEIAAAHGFCDQSHFGREFRRETGMTPREYRSRFRTAEQCRDSSKKCRGYSISREGIPPH
jgi:AraC-like DNA-binding protein